MFSAPFTPLTTETIIGLSLREIRESLSDLRSTIKWNLENTGAPLEEKEKKDCISVICASAAEIALRSLFREGANQEALDARKALSETLETLSDLVSNQQHAQTLREIQAVLFTPRPPLSDILEEARTEFIDQFVALHGISGSFLWGPEKTQEELLAKVPTKHAQTPIVAYFVSLPESKK